MDYSVLIVIDVQPWYKKAATLVEDAVVKEIKKAKRNREPIVIVLYGNRTQPTKKLREVLAGHKYIEVRKNEDDGGLALYAWLVHSSNRVSYRLTDGQRLNLDAIKRVKVCGVNTAACVIKTVKSLSYLRFPIKVLSYACATRFDFKTEEQSNKRHEKALERMSTWKNVEVI